MRISDWSSDVCSSDLPLAGVVALAGALDLDHLGAEVAQKLGAGRAGQDAGQVEDPQAGERSGHAVGVLSGDATIGVVPPQGEAVKCRGGSVTRRAAPAGAG